MGSGTAKVANSTLSANSVTLADGGGIWNSGFLALTNATFSGNQAVSCLLCAPSGGSGPAVHNAGTAVARNTIVAEPFGCGGVSLLATGTGNLEDEAELPPDAPPKSPTSSCGAAAGFTAVPDVALGSLADDGGPTKTHLPRPWSPALNAGTQSVCPISGTDQRGQPRTVGPACDVGSVEALPRELVIVLFQHVSRMDAEVGVRRSLLAKLAEVASIERGALTGASNQLRAFSQEVEAQRGEKIAESDARLLITGAAQIRQTLRRGVLDDDR